MFSHTIEDIDRAERTATKMPAANDIAEALAIAAADGSWRKYEGAHSEALIAELATAFDVGHVRLCASGTLAVEIALRAAGVGPGDEVIQSAYDYDANFLTVHALGAMPVLIDVDPQSGQLDPNYLQAARSPRTKAILATHLHGGLVPMLRVGDWARSHGIAVIEDAAQAAGAIVEGRPAGSHGDFGILSFGGSKLLAAGRGGAILSHEAKRDHTVKRLLTRGLQQWAAMSELQAIVLRPQLAKLPAETTARRDAVRRLANPIGPGLLPLANLDGMPAFYKVGFWHDPGPAGRSREEFCATLRSQGIAIDPGFAALHVGRSPSRFRAIGNLDQAKRMHDHCVILHHERLLDGPDAIDRMAAMVREAYRKRD